MNTIFSFFILIVCANVQRNDATNRYYNSYISYGSGDTIIQNFHQHGGPQLPFRKWNVECLDGEAMVGIQDFINDFFRLEQTWCKFTFPFKPPAQGRYPYYGGCHVRNLAQNFLCLDSANVSRTVNTFMTAIWANNLFFWVFRIPQDADTVYKCCKTPPGYYIDYVSCYYVPTHDPYFEYYDSINQFIVYCAQSYVMTGISKKPNPYTGEWFFDWIQCCRVGYGPPASQPPPVTYTGNRIPSYQANSGGLTTQGPAYNYESQYRTNNEAENGEDIDRGPSNFTVKRSTSEVLLRPESEQFLFEARGIRRKGDQEVTVAGTGQGLKM